MFQWGSVGWGGVITFMFLSTHRHSNLIIFLAVLQTQALLFHDQIPVMMMMVVMMMMIPMIMIMIFMGVQAREIVGVQASEKRGVQASGRPLEPGLWHLFLQHPGLLHRKKVWRHVSSWTYTLKRQKCLDATEAATTFEACRAVH